MSEFFTRVDDPDVVRSTSLMPEFVRRANAAYGYASEPVCLTILEADEWESGELVDYLAFVGTHGDRQIGWVVVDTLSDAMTFVAADYAARQAAGR